MAHKTGVQPGRGTARRGLSNMLPVLIIALLLLCVITFFAVTRSNNYIYASAQKLFAAGSYEEAALRYAEISGFNDADTQVSECYYRIALQYKTASQFTGAMSIFEGLGNYKDAPAQAEECRAVLDELSYASADALLAAEDYEAARIAYLALGDTPRAQAGVRECDYRLTLLRLAGAEPEAAIAELETWDGYADSTERIAALQESLLPDAPDFSAYAVGDYITLGCFEQDNNLENGAEPLEWLVISKTEDRLLLLTRYCIDCRPYQTDGSEVNWENCELRAWLNGEFYDTVFTTREASAVLEVTNPNPANPFRNVDCGSDTVDRVFLLSYEEVSTLFEGSAARRADSTPYCLSRVGGSIPGDYHPTLNAWWLRTAGWDHAYAVYVHADGHCVCYDSCQVYARVCTVRPALYISISGVTGDG